MIILGGLQSEQSNNDQLVFLELEAKNASVAKEYYTMRKHSNNHPEHLYKMTALKYNLEDKSALEAPRTVLVELTDGEYVLLLTKVLTYGSSYRYVHLYDEQPAIARKIIEQMYGYYEDGKKDGFEYEVTFDEVFENAKEIIQLKDYFFPGNPNQTMIFF